MSQINAYCSTCILWTNSFPTNSMYAEGTCTKAKYVRHSKSKPPKWEEERQTMSENWCEEWEGEDEEGNSVGYWSEDD